MSPVTDRWLSVDEIAAYLGVSRDTVYAWVSKKDMPGHRVGRLWKFKTDEVDGWVFVKAGQPESLITSKTARNDAGHRDSPRPRAPLPASGRRCPQWRAGPRQVVEHPGAVGTSRQLGASPWSPTHASLRTVQVGLRSGGTSLPGALRSPALRYALEPPCLH